MTGNEPHLKIVIRFHVLLQPHGNTADGNETANKRITIQNIFLDVLPKTWSFLADLSFLIFLSSGKF